MLLLTIVLILSCGENRYRSVNGISNKEIKADSSRSNVTSLSNNKKILFGSVNTTIDFTRLKKDITLHSQAKRAHSSVSDTGVFKEMDLLKFQGRMARSVNDSYRKEDRSAGFQCSDKPVCKCAKVNDTYIKADCSASNLQEVPTFDDNVAFINLNHNSIPNIPENTTFPLKVSHIDLSENMLQYIAKDAFGGLHRLTYLDISNNDYLSLKVLKNVTIGLMDSNIKVFKFNNIQCIHGVGSVLQRDSLMNLSTTTVEEIYSETNSINMVETGAINILPASVKTLSLSNNKLSLGAYWIELLTMPNLRDIRLSGMYFTVNPLASLFKPCIRVPTSRARKYYKLTFYLPETLEIIDFRYSMYQFDNFTRYVFLEAPNLVKVDFEGNYFRELYNEGMYRNRTEVVRMSNNFCTFISPDHFTNAVNIKELYLDNNYLGDFLSTYEAAKLFQNLGKLKVLDLSRNRMRKMTELLLSQNHGLTNLNLALNMLSFIEFKIAHMINLRILNLTQNRIKFLSKSNMHDLDLISRDHNLTIDLSGNELFCNCDTINFIRWIQRQTKDGSILLLNFRNYSCTYINSEEIELFHIDTILDNLQLHCSSNMGLIIGCVLCIVIFISVVLLSILYRYRWKIRYLYFTTKRALTNVQPQSDKIYRYNVFLSYADEDKDLAIKVILPYLENEGNKTVCCHTRDFTPGRTIADNITSAIHESHFTVCVISENYLKSYWCMYEFNLAKMESEYARCGVDVLFLILCQDIDLKNVPLNLMHHIENKCYLEVPNDDDLVPMAVFLQRLKAGLS